MVEKLSTFKNWDSPKLENSTTESIDSLSIGLIRLECFPIETWTLDDENSYARSLITVCGKHMRDSLHPDSEASRSNYSDGIELAIGR